MENYIEVYPTYDSLAFEEAFAKGLKPFLVDITKSRTKRLCVWARDFGSARNAVESMNDGNFIEFAPCDDDNDWIQILDDPVDKNDIEFYDNCVCEDDIAKQEKQEAYGKGFRISFQNLRRGDLKINTVIFNYPAEMVADVRCHRSAGELLGIPDYIERNFNDVKSVCIKYGTDAYRDVRAEFGITHPVSGCDEDTITIPIELSGDDKSLLWDLLREELEKRYDMTVNQYILFELEEIKKRGNTEFEFYSEEEMNNE